MNVGKSLVVAQAMNGISNQKMARRLGLSACMISKIRKNKMKTVRPELIDRLAAFFDMTSSEFISLGE